MLVTKLYDGQGLGNQLWSYVVTRTLALDKGLDFAIMSPEKFKGKDFLDLEFGEKVIGDVGPEDEPPFPLPEGISSYYVEKNQWHKKYKCDIRDFDPDLLKITDNTMIGGYFQSEKYILHRREEIRSWLRIKPAFECTDFSSENICVLNVRGGEYKGNPHLILPRKYWMDAVRNMLKINGDLSFVVITDDVRYAQKLLPEFRSFHFDIGRDYSAVKNAHYLILANSSFSFFPTWTSETAKYVIAPKYWARHNVSDGFWACAFNLYRDWMWQDRDGNLFTFNECEAEYSQYKIKHKVHEFGERPPAKPFSYWREVLPTMSRVTFKVRRRLSGR
jgi:hypothetical protein